MEHLFTPWRYSYIIANSVDSGCFFCAAARCPDDPEGLVVHVARHHLVMLNLHPYSNGHVMVAPLEHLASPERFLDQLRESLSSNPGVEILISTANIGFIIQRIMLLLGQFNYGKRGILDLTHTRLFTFSSFSRVIEQSGFEILEIKAVTAPFPLALGNTPLSRMLVAVNALLNRISRGMFAYQMFARIRPLPSVSFLLNAAYTKSKEKASALPL